MPNFELDRLQSQLNTSGLSNKDKPLYQVIWLLIKYLRKLDDLFSAFISGSSGGGGGTITNVFNDRRTIIQETIEENEETFFIIQGNQNNTGSSVDHVVMSDGATPIPEPVNDGFGNFIYIQYTP